MYPSRIELIGPTAIDPLQPVALYGSGPLPTWLTARTGRLRDCSGRFDIWQMASFVPGYEVCVHIYWNWRDLKNVRLPEGNLGARSAGAARRPRRAD